MSKLRRIQYREADQEHAYLSATIRAEQDAAYDVSLEKDRKSRKLEAEVVLQAKREAEREAEAEAKRRAEQKRFVESEEGRAWVRGQRLKYFENLMRAKQ